MSTKHTPGPWKAIGTRVYFPNLSGGFDISKCPLPEENARLIAASPELLEALQEAIELIECLDGRDNSCDPMSDLSDLKAAIHKATGEQA